MEDTDASSVWPNEKKGVDYARLKVTKLKETLWKGDQNSARAGEGRGEIYRIKRRLLQRLGTEKFA